MIGITLALFLQFASGGELPRSLREDPAAAAPQAAPGPDWGVGARWQIWTAYGDPANDMNGFSFHVAHRPRALLGEDAWLTLEFYTGKFDFENPGDQVLGTSGTPTADAVISLQIVSLTATWHPLAEDSWIDFYVGGGVGVAFTGDDDARSLPQVDVEVEGGTGFELHVVVGAKARIVGGFYLTAEIRALEFLTSFDVRDRQTGEEDSLDNFEAAGLNFGVEYRF